ncbi:MAG: hypothetical protein IT285_06235 [Bdellovibrionales bacterium]|nr:hypothetical protein [Bdellovibrionales bacterium]
MKLHEANPERKEAERLKAKLYGINSQLEAVAERLTQLPKSVSAAPIFKQMERLESAKREIEEALERAKSAPVNIGNRLVKLETFEAFTEHYRALIQRADHDTRKSLVQKFIESVEIGVDTVKIKWILDEEHYQRELALRGRLPAGSLAAGTPWRGGSHSLTNGAQGRT